MSELSAWDYVVFALMLVGSSLIGLYHGWKGSRVKEDTTDYLLAGRNMGWLPLFVSIVGSFLSAISLLGIPSEIYTYGGQFFLTIASFWVVMPLCIFIFAPLYRNIGITSANEYLELRFSRPVRIFGGVLFILQTVMYLSVVMYAPSLALEAVAGLRLEISLVVTVIICNIYTTIGGMKGVIWTDVFQTCIILIGLIVVLIIGTTQVGSFGDVIKIASDGGRTDIFRFDADPSVRNTFWGFIFGYTFTLMPFFCCGQICVQRYLSAKSNETITKSLFAALFGFTILSTTCILAGLVMYAVYHDCDPRHDKKINSNDQILAYFLVSNLSHLEGVPGIFMASLFSGALSTASSGLNSLAAITFEDIVKFRLPAEYQDKSVKYTKYIACLYGLVVLGGSFIVANAGSMVTQMTVSIQGIVAAPYFGMFVMGIFVPWANTKGAVSGCLFGLIFTGFICIGAIVYPPNKDVLSTSVRGCSSFNTTVANATTDGVFVNPFKPHEDPIASLFSVSYLWYATIGLFSSIIVGCIVSLLTGKEKNKISKELLFDYTPLKRCFCFTGSSRTVDINTRSEIHMENVEKS